MAYKIQYTFFLSLALFSMSCGSKSKEQAIKPVAVKQVYEAKLMHAIANDKLKVIIKTKGAELASIKKDNLEYLWQADPEIWPRHAPILFPIVGNLKDKEYIYKGETYKMKQHGFARDNDFVVIDKSKTSIVFEQRATKKSKVMYPFDFVLQVKYSLKGSLLKTEYVVKNPSDEEDLYFSIGGHPAFNCPFESSQKRNEYELVFDKKRSPRSVIKENKLIVDRSYPVFKEAGTLALPDTIFDKDALIFNPNPFSEVTFVHKPTQKAYLSVRFENYPYLGIWSRNSTSSFVCIEPWHGISAYKKQGKDFTEKTGIKKLVPNEAFSCSFTVNVH